MSIFGHTAASLLLVKAVSHFGFSPTNPEIILTIGAGTLLDLDYIYAYLTNQKGDFHHNFLTHTPIFSLLASLVIILLFNPLISIPFALLIIFSSQLHLILDNLNYWFYQLGWQKNTPIPQINWGYPFTKFSSKQIRTNSDKTAFLNYLTTTKVGVLAEIILVFSAVII